MEERGIAEATLVMMEDGRGVGERFECASSLLAWHYSTVPPPAMMDAAMMTPPVSVTIRRDCRSSSQQLAG
jgi:hypothetical protein